MNAGEAKALGREISARAREGDIGEGLAMLAPALAERIPFPKLGLIGVALASCPAEKVDAFLDAVAATSTEGGWGVIGAALGQHLEYELAGALERCRRYVVASDAWFGADILGERVPGPAMVQDFDIALASLGPWRADGNRWVRRAVGVAAHYWSKRSRGRRQLAECAGALLTFIEPMFEERDLSAAKGVGWGLKTLGRYYPELVVA